MMAAMGGDKFFLGGREKRKSVDNLKKAAACVFQFRHGLQPENLVLSSDRYQEFRMAVKTIEQISHLYHFTDRRNLDSIKSLGGLFPYSILVERGINIPAPGGNEWSHDADAMNGVDGDIHLCFRNNHPMEHVARQEGRLGDTIFLRINASVLQWTGVRFTSDVANKADVVATPIADAESIIDFEVLYTRTDWNDPQISARLQNAEKYEVLVPHVIPLDMIGNI
ncbi:MAG: DarT ssDNA thymidine ADP-ribosyltransferase family protein [Rhizobiaceae bacterium]